MPLGCVGSSRQALSEDQRQQIIAKLLSERRSQSASAAGRQQAALPEEERAARLQELINRRAAAKQQQGTQATAAERQQEPREPQELQHRHQQQQHQQHHQQQQHFRHHQETHHHQHQQQHQRQQESQQWQQQQHRHVQQHQPQRVQQRPASVSSIGSSHYGSCSQDPLLSPGSTNSLASGSAAARAGATHHHHHHHHHGPQQQQQQQLLQRPAPHIHAAAGRASSPDLRRQSGQQHPTPPQQRQQQQRQQVPARPPQQQQQQRVCAGDDHVLRHVLDGPVDISDLWASRASLTEATSLDQQGLDERARPYHTRSTHHSSSSSSGSSSRSSSDGGSTGIYDGVPYHAETAYGAAGRHSSSDCWLGSSYGGDGGGGGGVLEQYSDVLSDDEGGGVGWRSGLQVGVDGQDVHGPSWELSGALSFTPAHHLGQRSAQQATNSHQQQQQQRLQELRRLQQELLDHRQQHGSRPTSRTHHARQQQQLQQQGQGVRARPSPPAQPRHAQQPVRAAHLPSSYPLSRSERLQQLAQPKVANRHKYEQMKADAEQQALQQCSFTPKTGRGPQHRCAPPGTVGERLYQTAAEKKTRLEQKAVELANSSVAACTFQPQTNASANARVLESYEYVPLHKRLGQVMRSRSEKLAHMQQQVEAEVSSSATFAPRINPRSSVLASMRRSRSCSRLQQEDTDDRSPSPARGRGRGCDTAPSSPHARGEQDVGRNRSRERSDRMRRTRSEAGMSRSRSRHHPDDASCTFTPSINANSQALLQASGEIPLSFLQRQEYFDRLAREKKQLLQLAVEDQHCSFGATAAGTRSSSRSSRSERGLSVDQESFLDRIERLAYTDKRRLDASRSALADVLHNSECTFRPAINPRSARMAQATPLDELYSNSKGRMRREGVALALELQHEAECTFSPNLHKPGVRSAAPPEAKLNLSAEEVACVVERLYPDQRSKEARVGEAASYQQYKELKHCTFTPEINRDVPRQQGPVLVRGLGRFLELKDMARQAAEAKAAVEAKVFITQPKQPTAPFTTPQPFRLGPEVPLGYEARRRRAQAEAEAATMAECTFKPCINSHHKTRQERVAELLAGD